MTSTRTVSRVVLIGGNSIVREGLRSLLSGQHRQIILAGCSLAELSTLDHPDDDFLLLLIEDGPSEWNGSTLEAVHRQYPAARIAILAHEFDYQTMLNAFRAGIEGYLTNDVAWERLIGYLDLIDLGEKIFPSQLAQKLIDEGPPSDSGEIEDAATIESANLSGREMDILRRLIAGLPNKVISRQLAISEATVKVHVKAVLRKLRVTNRTQAAIWAAGQGIHGRGAPEEPLVPPCSNSGGPRVSGPVALQAATAGHDSRHLAAGRTARA